MLTYDHVSFLSKAQILDAQILYDPDTMKLFLTNQFMSNISFFNLHSGFFLSSPNITVHSLFLGRVFSLWFHLPATFMMH